MLISSGKKIASLKLRKEILIKAYWKSNRWCSLRLINKTSVKLIKSP